MGPPSIGAIVLVPFPFTDLSQSKIRPAVCLASVGRGDWIFCQITSQAYGDPRSVPLASTDFVNGGLRIASWARPGKLFTANGSLCIREVGTLTDSALDRIVDGIVDLLRPAKSP